MSLPIQAVDRLFQRLAATYGATWDRSLGNAPLADVKTAWAHELAGFACRLQDLAWGLENLPETAPNAIQFRNLCRRAPASSAAPRIEEAPASPERVRAELAKLRPSMQSKPKGGIDVRWAHRIVAKAEAGQPVNSLPLRMAREAIALAANRGAQEQP